MRTISLILLMSLYLAITCIATSQAAKLDRSPEALEKGATIYHRACIFCHGIAGKGDGPAAFFASSYSAPRPKDFTRKDYKFRSTISGELPTDQDLFRTITNGIPGYMPPFEGLTETERWNVIAYIKTFSPAFQTEHVNTLITLEMPPRPATSDSIARGRMMYLELECHVCHGLDATGHGPVHTQGDLKDNTGLPIQPTNLTNLPSFKNGASPQDIARTILTGLDGAPMPSYASAFSSPDTSIWHMVNYVLSLSTATQP